VTSSELDEKILKDSQAVYEQTEINKQPQSGLSIGRLIMKSRITKLAAAALIIVGTMIGINIFPIGGASVAFGKMIEATKEMPWMHIVLNENRKGETKKEELWYSFKAKIQANKKEDGIARFYDYSNNKAYVYTPAKEEITISHLPDMTFSLGAESPWEFVEKAMKAVNDNTTKITQRSEQYDGKRVDVFTIEKEKMNNINEEWQFVVDNRSRLLLAIKAKGFDPNGNIDRAGEFIFDYPEKGPNSIYELGVPVSAKVIDISSVGTDVEDIIKTYYTYRSDSPSHYIAVVTKSRRNEQVDGDIVTAADVIYVDGKSYRIEKYAIPDLAALLENWPEYSVEMGDTLDSMLQWWTQSQISECIGIKLYDGQKTYLASFDKNHNWVVKSYSPPSDDVNYQTLADLAWPQSGLFVWAPDLSPIMVVETEYSKQNNLICLQSLQQGAIHDNSVRSPYKKLWYLNPRCNYICQRFEEHNLRNASAKQ
jgi:hypothetical protein